jgi:hypothetical protein
MNHKIFMICRNIIVILFMILYYQAGYGQQEQIDGLRPPGFNIGFGVTPSLSQIKSTENLSGFDLRYKKKYSLSGYLEAGYFFNKNIGITTGLNYSSYNIQIDLDSYTSNLEAIDQENEPYELRVFGKNLAEKQYVGIIGIPICINMRFNIKKEFGAYLQTGINIAMPLENRYETNGTFTYSGFYSAYNVVLKDLPEYGFPSDLSTSKDGNLKLKPVIYCVIASAGIDYIVRNKFQLSLGVAFNKSLESISDYIPPNNFQLSTGANQLSSLMEGSSNVLLESIGISVGLRYFISDFQKHKYSHLKKNYLKDDHPGRKVDIEK